MKKRNVFAPLTGVKGKNTHVTGAQHSKNERWLYGVLSADDEAPTVEDEKSGNRFYLLFVAAFLLFAVLFGRAFWLQIVEGNKSLVLAQENRFRELVIRAPRGLFYDRNKIPLVKNIPNYEVIVIPNDLPKNEAERNQDYERLSQTIGMTKEEIKKQSEEKGLNYIQSLPLSKNVSRDVSLIFESREQELKGFYVETNPIREYLDNGLLSHVFGYVGRISKEEFEKSPGYQLTDFLGKTGLEKSYEKLLKGKPGVEKVERDSTGKVIRTYGQEDPILGDNLQLSIDFGLQKKLTEALTTQMQRAKVEKAAAVAIDPKTGEVLAYVNIPSYDNNLFAKGISTADYEKLLKDKNTPLLDRIASGEYPSGSIIKPFIAAGALEEGTVNETTTVLSNGGIKIGDYSFPDWKAGGHGVTNVIKAIAESVNTYFYAIGGGYQNIKGLGPEVIKKYLEKFGFDSSPIIDIDGAASGHIPDPEWKERVINEPWYLGDTYHMAIGQGDVLVTPLQMVNALQAIANGGSINKLHFVKSVLDSDGNVKSQVQPEVVKKDFISAKTLDIIRRGMRACVTSGSGKLLNSLPVEAAAKTGTAQFGPNNEKKHAWFEAFAPYNDPQIAMVILLEGAGEGSDFAAPVANDTLKWYFSQKR
jgi:penicillin-binding protein 2